MYKPSPTAKQRLRVSVAFFFFFFDIYKSFYLSTWTCLCVCVRPSVVCVMSLQVFMKILNSLFFFVAGKSTMWLLEAVVLFLLARLVQEFRSKICKGPMCCSVFSTSVCASKCGNNLLFNVIVRLTAFLWLPLYFCQNQMPYLHMYNPLLHRANTSNCKPRKTCGKSLLV